MAVTSTEKVDEVVDGYINFVLERMRMGYTGADYTSVLTMLQEIKKQTK